MTTLNDTDLFLVNRGGVDYKITATELKEFILKEPEPLPPLALDITRGSEPAIGATICCEIISGLSTEHLPLKVEWVRSKGGVKEVINELVTNDTSDPSYFYDATLDDLDWLFSCRITNSRGEVYETSCDEEVGIAELRLTFSAERKHDYTDCNPRYWTYGYRKNAPGFTGNTQGARVDNVWWEITRPDTSEVWTLAADNSIDVFHSDSKTQYPCVKSTSTTTFEFKAGDLVQLKCLWRQNNYNFEGESAMTHTYVMDDDHPPQPSSWDDADAIYHVIINDPADIKVTSQDKIYNLTTGAEVSSITAAGEWIITGVVTRFGDSPGNWQFGDLTDTSKVTNMGSMFHNASVFNQNLTNWDVGNVTNMRHMFDNALAFKGDISNWDVSNVTDMGEMFADVNKCNANVSNWNVGKVMNMNRMFYNCTYFNSDISEWDVGKVRDMYRTFANCYAFNQNISNWDTSNVEKMRAMFEEAHAFNQNITGWDTSNVEDMRSMFKSTWNFEQDLSKWCVTYITSEPGDFKTFSAMPQKGEKDPVWGTCPGSAPPAPWDGVQGIYHVIVDKPGDIRPSGYAKIYNLETKTEVSSINAAGEWIITGNKTCFKESNGNWQFGDLTDTSKVTNMYQMFEWTNFNSDISNWDVSNVTNMTSAFYYAFAFNQDLSGWCVSKLPNGKDDTDFNTGSSMPTDGSYLPKWGTCP